MVPNSPRLRHEPFIHLKLHIVCVAVLLLLAPMSRDPLIPQPVCTQTLGEFRVSTVPIQYSPFLIIRSSHLVRCTATNMKFACKRGATASVSAGIRAPPCISLIKRCDRILDCEDGSDEEGCVCHGMMCTNAMQLCSLNVASLKRIRSRPRVYSHMHTCPPGIARCFCNPVLIFLKSDENLFECVKNRDCIPAANRCDGKHDCVDATDEMDCPNSPATTVSVGLCPLVAFYQICLVN